MMYPGLASWAKFSRPCGTEFVNPGSQTPSKALRRRVLDSSLGKKGLPAEFGSKRGGKIRFFTEDRLIFSFYSPIVVPMRALPFPKSCVVCCKTCGHDVLAGTESFPASSIFVVCSLCGEKRKYLPSEVI